MARVLRIVVIVFASSLGLLFLFVLVSQSSLFTTEVWTRTTPLSAAITTAGVRDGVVTLADGRKFRPAGVTRCDGVSTEAYDSALLAIVAQGVVVIRDLGDGRAFLLAEPKFHNWCGTRGYGGNPWAHWAGAYIQCPVSELLIHCGYAKASLDEAGLAPREQEKLAGVESVVGIRSTPTRVLSSLGALDFDGSIPILAEYERMWGSSPSP